MKTTYSSKTFSVSIQANPNDVYAFVANPENLPKWATAFCKSITKKGTDWIMTTDLGSAKIKFVDKNEHGILDHFVYPAPDVEVYVPMRVVPNKSGCEVLFTLFRLPFMDEVKFQADMKLVDADLNTLKKTMEA